MSDRINRGLSTFSPTSLRNVRELRSSIREPASPSVDDDVAPLAGELLKPVEQLLGGRLDGVTSAPWKPRAAFLGTPQDHYRALSQAADTLRQAASRDPELAPMADVVQHYRELLHDLTVREPLDI